KILNFGFSKFIDNDFADLFLFFVYRQLFFSQIKTFFLGVFRASNLRRIGPIIPYGMVEIRASARMFLILIAVFIFRVRESVEGTLVIIDVTQQQSLI